MNHRLTHAVWEITYACNMRCKHCGSSCGGKYPDELTLSEALALCDDLGDLGLKVITLSGGEPLLHKNRDTITKRLTDNNIAVNIISNGWFIDEEMIERACAAGLVHVGLSIDRLEETHDFIRKKGSFKRIIKVLKLLKKKGIKRSPHSETSMEEVYQLLIKKYNQKEIKIPVHNHEFIAGEKLKK